MVSSVIYRNDLQMIVSHIGEQIGNGTRRAHHPNWVLAGEDPQGVSFGRPGRDVGVFRVSRMAADGHHQHQQ